MPPNVIPASAKSPAPWPDSMVPEPTQRLLQAFFKLLDDETNEGAKAYSELFTLDSSYYVLGTSEFHGREAMREQRAWAWKTWPGMTHSVGRLYAADEKGLDLVVIGGYEINEADGNLVSGGSAANFQLMEKDGELLIHRLEVFADPNPLLKLVPAP